MLQPILTISTISMDFHIKNDFHTDISFLLLTIVSKFDGFQIFFFEVHEKCTFLWVSFFLDNAKQMHLYGEYRSTKLDFFWKASVKSVWP